MSIKSSINKVSSIRVLFFFFIFLIITKIECWPVFKQDPMNFGGPADDISHCTAGWQGVFQYAEWVDQSNNFLIRHRLPCPTDTAPTVPNLRIKGPCALNSLLK